MNQKIDNLSSLINENRLKVLLAIYKCSDDVCACNLVDSLDIPKNLLSYHIKMLRDSGYIEETKCGRFRKYQIKKDKIELVKKFLEFTGMLKGDK
jgi:ArsR family transcriptional regulator, arsenate/arsenite/antimonite-responsive transcriptional repressor